MNAKSSALLLPIAMSLACLVFLISPLLGQLSAQDKEKVAAETVESLIAKLEEFESMFHGFRVEVAVDSDSRPGKETIETTADGKYRRAYVTMEGRDLTIQSANYVSLGAPWGFKMQRTSRDREAGGRLTYGKGNPHQVLGWCSFMAYVGHGMADGRSLSTLAKESTNSIRKMESQIILASVHPENGTIEFAFDQDRNLVGVHQIKKEGDLWHEGVPPATEEMEQKSDEFRYGTHFGKRMLESYRHAETIKGETYTQKFTFTISEFKEKLGERIELPECPVKIENGTPVRFEGPSEPGAARYEYKDGEIIRKSE